MSTAYKFFRHCRTICRGRRLAAGCLASATAVTIGLKHGKNGERVKDQIVYLSDEENRSPSSVKILQSEVEENRDALLPSGELNWACTCIERDVIGPCGPEFRPLRQIIHDCNYSRENMTPEQKEKFDEVLEAYIECTMDHPQFYKSHMTEEEQHDMEEAERRKQEKEEAERKQRQQNYRDFGKDKVLFLSKKENSVPSKAQIPETVVSEDRGPVLPNGDLNWACTCIERDVIGPCNIEFRVFRQYIHDNHDVDISERSEEDLLKLHGILKDFMMCAKNYPQYYRSLLKDVDEDDIKKVEELDMSAGNKTRENTGEGETTV